VTRLLAAAAAYVAVGCLAAGCASAPASEPRSVSSSRAGPTTLATSASSSAAPFQNKVGTHPARLDDLQRLAARAPIRLLIPALGVNAPDPGRRDRPGVGTDAAAAECEHVAWWSYGARPGDRNGVTVLSGACRL